MKFVVAVIAVVFSLECAAQNPLRVTHEKIHERLRKEWAKRIVPLTPLSKADGEAYCDDIRLTKPAEPGVFAKGAKADFWFITSVNGKAATSPDDVSAEIDATEIGKALRIEGRAMIPGVQGKKRPTWSKVSTGVVIDSPWRQIKEQVKEEVDGVEKFVNIRAADEALDDPVKFRVHKENAKAPPRLIVDLLLVNDEWVFPSAVKISVNDQLFEIALKDVQGVRRNTAEKTFEAFVLDISERPDIAQAFLDETTKNGTVRFDGRKAVEDRSITLNEMELCQKVINVYYHERFGD